MNKINLFCVCLLDKLWICVAVNRVWMEVPVPPLWIVCLLFVSVLAAFQGHDVKPVSMFCVNNCLSKGVTLHASLSNIRLNFLVYIQARYYSTRCIFMIFVCFNVWESELNSITWWTLIAPWNSMVQSNIHVLCTRQCGEPLDRIFKFF